jgi:DNA-binding HxlR family transcriptional regulator
VIRSSLIGMPDRTYDDSCALARALDVIGDRWSMLIVRELLFGPKRFVDLRRGLSRISQNVLSQRLHDLERVGVVRGITLAPPANTAAYALTERGQGLRPALRELARWGALAPTPEGAEQSAAAFLLTLDALFDGSHVAQPMVAVLGVERERFTLRLAGDGLTATAGETSDPDLRLTGTIPALRAVLIADRDPEPFEATGELTLAGNDTGLARVRACFPVPAPVGPAG